MPCVPFGMFKHARQETHTVDSIFDLHVTMPDVIFPIPELGDGTDIGGGDMTLAIGAAGGCALGARHRDSWFVEVTHRGEIIYSSKDLHTQWGKTHLEAAVLFARFAAEGETSGEPFGKRLETWVHEFVDPQVWENL